MQKEQLEEEILKAIASGLEQEKITVLQSSEIAKHVLTGIDSISTDQEVVDFLAELNSKWSIFNNLLVTEKGEIESEEDKQVVGEAMELVKEGRIEEALAMAKSATQG